MAISFALALQTGPRMALVVMSAMPLVAVGMAAQGAAASRTAGAVAAHTALAQTVADQTLRGVRTIAAYGLEADAVWAYELMLAPGVRAAMVGAAAVGVGAGTAQAALNAMFALAFWYGGRQVAAGRLAFGGMMRVFFTVVLAANALADVQGIVPALGRAADAVDRCFGVLEAPSPIERGGGGGGVAGGAPAKKAGRGAPAAPPPAKPTRLTIVAGEVRLDRVAFAYPTRPGHPVFRDFSLAAPPRTATALVGPSGCGKSTVIGLVARFYDPARGRVLLDGVDVKGLDLAWYRGQVALVAQEPVLFTGTVRENVSGRKEGKWMEREREGQKTRTQYAPPTLSPSAQLFTARPRQTGRQRRGNQGRRPRHQRPGLHQRAGGGPGHADRVGARRGATVGRPAPAPGHRPGRLAARPGVVAGRGDRRPGRGVGG